MLQAGLVVRIRESLLRIDLDALHLPAGGEGEDLPGGALIDLERLNSLLVSVNVLYLREFGIKLPDRIPLASLGEMLP